MPSTGARRFSFADRLLAEVDGALRTLSGAAPASRPDPSASTPRPTLTPEEQALSAALMRVNHAGEVAAQALYRGQAFVARDPALREELLAAADDEHAHLAWCADRVHELGEPVSRLSPLWYVGSFVLGAAAGLAGDARSLGFLAETEKQVTEHLDGHLRRLPAGDTPSRRIVDQMRTDEIGHRNYALDRGGAGLPGPVRGAMRLTARVMTTLAHRV